MVYFLLGIIIGILVREIKFYTIKGVNSLREVGNQEKTDFFEPISDKEKFNNAKSIDETL